MPVLTDEDVGLGSSYLTDEDVGLMEDEYAGGETQSPEELASDEEKADELAAMKQARKTGRFSANAATAIGALGEIVEPFAVTPQNPLGAFGTAAGGLGKIAEYTGEVGKGVVQDLRLGNITGLPSTSQALSTGRAPNLEPTSLPARIIEGTGQGIGEMVPALAAGAVGVPPIPAFSTLMGSRAYQQTGGDIGETAKAALLGAVLPGIANLGKSAAAKAIVGATRYAPNLASSPTISKSIEAMGSQVAQNTVMGLADAPELMRLYKEDPNKFYDRAAEMIGVNLAMGAHDIMRIADPRVRSQSGQEIAELIRPKMPEIFQGTALVQSVSGPPGFIPPPRRLSEGVSGQIDTSPPEPRRFTPPERGGIPEPVRTTGEPDVIQEPGRKAQPPVEAPQVAPTEAQAQSKEGNAPQEPGVLLTPETRPNEAIQLPKKPAQEPMNPVDAHEFANWARDQTVSKLRQLRNDHEADPNKNYDEIVGVINDAIKEKSTSLKASLKPQESIPQAPALDKSKWTKATDVENLKAATPEQRIVAAQKPLDVDSFLREDTEGYRAVDPEKLMKSLEGGHITGGSPAVDALLLHLLKPSDLHPLSSIRMLDFTPGEAQLLTGTSAPFHGRFSKKGGESSAMVEMTMKMQKGEPVSQAQFVETLAHELGHNNITSKFADATPEMRKDIDDVFAFARERGKGTEWENHNSLTSAHELFAEIADPKVYEWLAGLDYTADIRKVDIGIAKVPAITPPNIRNSALGRILEIAKKLLKLPDFITDAFGNKVETITALDQIISLSSRLEKIKRSGKEAGSNLSEAKPTGDFKSAIKEVDKVSNAELEKRGGATKFMWDLGAKAKTAEDVAALKKMAEESTAKAKELAKEGKIEEAMAIAGRQPAEAYEYATGVKLDGTVKWTTMEKMEPGYVPPVPDAKYIAAKGGAAKVEVAAASENTADSGAPKSQVPPPLESQVAAAQQPTPSAFSISNIDELAGKLREAGSADSPAMGPDFKRRFDEAISRSGDSEIPVEKLVKGINSARITVNKENGSLTIHTEGYGAGDKISHETVTVTATEDGSLRMFASGGKTQRLLKFSIEQAADLFKPKTPTVKESLIVEPPKAQPPPPDKPTTTAAPAAEPDGSKMETSQKWTGATEEKPETGLGGQMLAGIPNPAAVYRGIQKAVKDYGPSVKAAGRAVSDAVRDIYKENLNIRKMGDLDRSVLRWSAKLQRSFGEASSAQKDIQAAVKDPVRDAALTNWLEAGGDKAKLTAWRDGTADPKLRAGYEAALNLTPEEMKIAQDARVAYDVLGDRGTTYEVLRNFKDDYVTHIWDLGKGSFAGGARTLKDQFKFAKARTFANYFEGEQAGFKPKTKRLSQLLPVYVHEMNSVIAAKQLVKQMWGGKAKDGSPLLATRGQAVPVSGAKGEAVLVRPEAPSPDSAKKGLDISKYKELPGHPALHDWVFAGKDTAGNPIFEKSDLVLHPEAYKKLKAILGKSKIREWYESEGTGPLATTMKIPKAIAKGLDLYQQETKRTMFGLFAPFHQVQEAWHGVGHRILPTPATGGQSTKAGALKLPKPDLDNPEIYDMAKNGLMILPDRASEAHFMDGMRHSGLVSHIPWVGKAADGYSKYLFHEVIPGLKIKTYAAALERNKGVYAKDLASGEVNLEDVKLLTATQVNAAYGHLNYADFGRDPTIQHILQLGLLAPDFLEARMRFFGQGLKGLVPELGAKGERVTGARGNKVGREQLYALATLAAAQALLAYTGAKLTDGEWDGKHPFEFRKGNRKYTLRSVPEDMQRFWEDIRNVFRGGGEIPFISHRLNPVTGRGPLQLLTGRDWRQQKITPQETAKQLALAPIPLTARSFMGIDKSPLEDWEQLAGAAGLKIMNYSAQGEVRKMLLDWKKGSEDPKLVAQAEEAEAQTFAPSAYSDLRQALEKEDSKAAGKAYEKLLDSRTPLVIHRAMKPLSMDPDTGVMRDRMLPKALEKRFLESLKDDEREVYEAAKRQRRVLYQRFQRMLEE